MNQMSGPIEGESVLRKRPAEAAHSPFLFEENRIVFGQMISSAHTGQTAADDDDSIFVHERMSTFRSRYAERHAAEIAPNIVPAAHASVTWLVKSATPLRSAPIMYVVTAVSRTESLMRRRGSAKWSGLPFITGIPFRHRIHITKVRSNSGIPRIRMGLVTARRFARV